MKAALGTAMSDGVRTFILTMWEAYFDAVLTILTNLPEWIIGGGHSVLQQYEAQECQRQAIFD